MNIKTLIGIIGTAWLASCGTPEKARDSVDEYPPIFPDYTCTAVPYNIAPLNFEVKNAKALRVDFSAEGAGLLTVSGNSEVRLPEKKWREMLSGLKGKQLDVTVSVWNERFPDGVQYRPFPIRIASEPIDQWVAYRLIEPGYEGWNAMGIYQRDLTSFEEKEIVTNHRNKKQCMNCHSFAAYSPDRMLFHVRGQGGGTALWKDGKLEKIALEKLGPQKGGAYPMWHPGGRYIVFSSNDTKQSFLSEGRKPLEVYDLRSDLILYDTRTGQMTADPRFNDEDHWETFPAWSPDGQSLYFCTALPKEMPVDYASLYYHLCRVAFDESTGTFGRRIDTLYHAGPGKGSVSFPRISPDGNYLLYTRAASATFPVWHKEADLKMIRLSDGKEVDTAVLNSNEAESYHSWSSNGRWILFGSRRLDGRYTRLFIAYMDGQGQLHKPFLLPQRSPEHNVLRMKSYNIPEFIRGEVQLPADRLESLFFSKD